MLKRSFWGIFDRDGACVGVTTHVEPRPGSVRKLAGWLKAEAGTRLPERGPFTVRILNKA